MLTINNLYLAHSYKNTYFEYKFSEFSIIYLYIFAQHERPTVHPNVLCNKYFRNVE